MIKVKDEKYQNETGLNIFQKKLKIKKGMGKEYIHVDVWLRTSGLEKKSITLGPHLQLIESPTAQFLTL